MEVCTSVAARGPISIQAALPNGKKTLSHLTLSVFLSKHLLWPFVGLTAVNFQVFLCQQKHVIPWLLSGGKRERQHL